MEIKSKNRPLRGEPFIFGGALVVLLIALVATVYSLVMIHWAGTYAELHLTMASMDQVWNPMREQYQHRTDDIALYPPPSDEKQLLAWMDSIRSHVSFPVAIFRWRDTTIQAVSVPEHLQGFFHDLPRLVNPGTPRGQRMKPDTVGSMVLWGGDARRDTLRAHVKGFQRLGESQAWGILYRFDDARREMAEEILAYDPHKMLASRPWVWSIDSRGGIPAFRMFDGDSVIAATPDLDTTRLKYAEKQGGIHFEYYLSSMDQTCVDLILHPRILYFLLIVEAAMIACLWVMHRWINKLRGA